MRIGFNSRDDGFKFANSFNNHVVTVPARKHFALSNILVSEAAECGSWLSSR